MEILVNAALVDWDSISDASLPEVCARARVIVAEKPNKLGLPLVPTLADILKAREELAEEASRAAYHQRRAAYERAVKERRILPQALPRDLREDEKEAFWENFYHAAGIPRSKADDQAAAPARRGRRS